MKPVQHAAVIRTDRQLLLALYSRACPKYDDVPNLNIGNVKALVSRRGSSVFVVALAFAGQAPYVVATMVLFWFVPAGDTLSQHGVVTVIPNYTLYPSSTMVDMVADLSYVLEWVVQNIASLGGDPRRIYLVGHSAGGHLGMPPSGHCCGVFSRLGTR